VLARAVAAGVERLLVPGFDLPSSRAAVALAAAHPGLVQAAVGIHPHYAAAATAADWVALEALVAAPQVVAVGEIGLDYFRNLSPPAAQRAAFKRQLALAAGAGKPVLVHDRDAHEAVTATLLTWRGPWESLAGGVTAGRPRGVLHAFSGDGPMAARLVDAGYLVSFALPVAFRSAAGPRAAAAALPDGTFLVETDAPWLAPGGSGARNEPTTVLRVAAELARLRGSTPQAVADGARRAYERLVGR
jgi:TatD DNase family protein